MKIHQLDSSNLPYHRDCILALAQDTAPQWGGLNAAQMCAHLRALVECSLGEVEMRAFMPTVIGRPMGLLFFYVIRRFPHGKKGSTPPMKELFPADVGTLDVERDRLLASMERFTQQLSENPHRKTRHPFMGMTTLKRWSQVHAVHNRHHYRQFGVAQPRS
jgi:hypothetical protein